MPQNDDALKIGPEDDDAPEGSTNDSEDTSDDDEAGDE